MRYLTKKEKLSRFLIRERLARGLSQQEMAEKVDASWRNYQRWERGEIFPYSYSWGRLEEFFGESLNEAMRADVVEDAAEDRPVASGQGETMAVSPEEGEDDQASSETFPEADGGKVGTTYSGPRRSTALEGGIKRKFVVLSTILVVLVVVGIGVFVHIAYPPQAIKPGGAWISPAGKTVSDVIHFAAYAYPTHSGDPAIDHVNFTMYWQGVDPRKWVVGCVARRPVRDDMFACDVDLRELGVPAGEVRVSFDVYDRDGDVNLSPNGEHLFVYVPAATK